MEDVEQKNIALIGLGPHAKRSYLRVLQKNNNLPKLIIDLKSQEESIREYLAKNGIEAEIFSIPDENKDDEVLQEQIYKTLLDKVKELNISHALISTEPKAHFAYMKFFIENGINTLSDKPITAVKDMHKVESINKLKQQYNELVKLYEQHKDEISCKIMCQRRFHKGYEYILNLVEDTIKKYNIPITYLDIYHCDGKWMMPHDYDVENHPYKYGYGKMFHSGYHFVDMLAEFIKLNKFVSNDKKITDVDINTARVGLPDELTTMSREDILNLFKDQEIPEFYDNEIDKSNYENYGEKDFHALMDFKNKDGRTITIANMDMLQTGFSRRAWIQTKPDMYKGNGRIRHESLNLQIGPLMNIQIHSYQSKEIQEREDFKKEQEVGGLENFDILVFRNSDLIGGEPFEEIHLGDLYQDVNEENFEGYNELAREEFIMDFINGGTNKSDLLEHKLAMELLYRTSLELNKNMNKNIEQVPKHEEEDISLDDD